MVMDVLVIKEYHILAELLNGILCDTRLRASRLL